MHVDKLSNNKDNSLREAYNRVYETELKKIDENNFAREAIARHYAKRWLELHVQLEEVKKAFRNG